MYLEQNCPVFENKFSKNKKILIFLFIILSLVFLIEKIIRRLNKKTEENSGEFFENKQNVENWKLILLCLFSFFFFFTVSFFLIKLST